MDTFLVLTFFLLYRTQFANLAWLYMTKVNEFSYKNVKIEYVLIVTPYSNKGVHPVNHSYFIKQ